MTQPFSFYCYLFILLIDVIIGAFLFKRTDSAIRIIIILLFVTFLSEIATLYYANFFKRKAPIYHIYSVFEIVLTSIFFLKTINVKNYNFLLIFVLVIWPSLGLVNYLFLQSLRKINSNFLTLESIAIIAMALYALYKIMLDDNITNVLRNTNFCLWILFLFFWSSTFFFWACFEILIKHHSPYRDILLNIQVAVNIIFYVGIGITLIFSKKVT